VTDADLLMGRIPPEGLPGLGRLDRRAAAGAFEREGLAPEGVIAVVDEAMTQALRAVSVGRGVDPAGLALVAFGGAGPLHACALADELRMPTVVVPPRAGVLSAVGILAAPRQVELVSSWSDPADHTGALLAAEGLSDRARHLLGQVQASRVRLGFDCRYKGQSHELMVDDIAAFESEHLRRSGYTIEGAPVQIMAIRASAQSDSRVDLSGLEGTARLGPVRGPRVIAEPDCTVWVGEGWIANAHPTGSWLLERAV
jgi:N-methylhydantoinase A/oxoprolinase/acetone carboxylase beta subunit